MKINTLKMMCMKTLEKNSDYLKPMDKDLAQSTKGLAEDVIDSLAGEQEATGLYQSKTREYISNDVCVIKVSRLIGVKRVTIASAMFYIKLFLSNTERKII